MLTGAPPFTGSRVFDILTKQVTEIPSPLPTKRPGVPIWMEAAVAKMLAKDPENRFATTTRMVEALRRGLETGEVMEDQIARRRESIPPPSVSRVMQKMGISTPAEEPVQSAKAAALPVLGAAPAPAKPASRTPTPAPVAAPAPAPVLGAAPPPARPAPRVTPAPAAPPPGSQFGPPAMPPPASERRRTGTPQVGVPVVDEQAPVTGVIEAKADRSGPTAEPGISQAWYEDDDSRKHTSPSTTDMSLYDEPPMRKRWPIVAGVLAVLLVGAAATFAFTQGGTEKKVAPPPATVAQAPVATPPAPVPPSTIIDPGPGSAAVGSGSAAVAKVAPVAHDPSPPAHKETAPAHVAKAKETSPTDHSHKGPFDDISADDLAKRRPGGPNTTTTPTTTTTTVVTPPKDTAKPGVSGAEGPQDPYGGGAADPGDGAAPDKKAEFYANLGQQQLGGGDLAGAAASFKKATELDPKSTNAFIGMGQIALRQGLFGDAIAHLRKAARLAPRNTQVFTLLGEAYLGAGQSSTAADNFKKALQLDPENARARDGYNEASSRVPPPSDDN
jgi:hypothetical protein